MQLNDVNQKFYFFFQFRSIARTAQVTPEQMAEAKKSPNVQFDHPKEWKLSKLILRFPEIILKALDDMTLHPICDFLYELATTFTEFYDACYVCEKDRQTGELSISAENSF